MEIYKHDFAFSFIQFSKTFQLQYRFEEVQKLKFVVVDIDDKVRIDDISKHDLIGELECTLADLVTAGQQYERTLRLNGELMWGHTSMHDKRIHSLLHPHPFHFEPFKLVSANLLASLAAQCIKHAPMSSSSLP